MYLKPTCVNVNSTMQTIPNPQFEPTIVTITNLIQLLKVRVSKTAIRNYFSTLPNYPAITLGNINQAFNHWNIKSKGLKVPSEKLCEVSFPAIAYITEFIDVVKDDKPDTAPMGIFIVLTGADASMIHFIHPTKSLTSEDTESFLKKWNSLVLVPIPDENSVEETFEKSTQEEQAASDLYKQTIKYHHDFFTPEECRELISYCDFNNLFDRSGVGSARYISTARTSFSAMIRDREKFNSIYERACSIVNCSKDQIEDIQCVRYLPGQEFRVHFDSDGSILRKQTLLVYLNDDFTGGETLFPEINLIMSPKAGMCIQFVNLDQENKVLANSAHSGLPVKTGIKYACNIWISPMSKNK